MGERKRVELRKWALGEHNYYQEHTRCENKRPPAVCGDRVHPRGPAAGLHGSGRLRDPGKQKANRRGPGLLRTGEAGGLCQELCIF